MDPLRIRDLARRASSAGAELAETVEDAILGLSALASAGDGVGRSAERLESVVRRGASLPGLGAGWSRPALGAIRRLSFGSGEQGSGLVEVAEEALSSAERAASSAEGAAAAPIGEWIED